jgi:hypothetical protein
MKTHKTFGEDWLKIDRYIYDINIYGVCGDLKSTKQSDVLHHPYLSLHAGTFDYTIENLITPNQTMHVTYALHGAFFQNNHKQLFRITLVQSFTYSLKMLILSGPFFCFTLC